MSSTSNNNSTSSTAVRVDYSKYVADITGSPKVPRQSATTGIGHHINPLHNPYPNRQSQSTQQQQQGGMPQYGGAAEKCARCSKTVYIAEKKVGAGRSFHSSCFSCYTCKRKLDSTALSEHKGEIYCKSCYTKQFGAHGLISGVTMSTEQTATHDERYSRRSSYGSDLDTPNTIRSRTYSNENIITDEYGINQKERSPTKTFERQYRPSEQNSPPKKNNDGLNAIVDTKYQRTPSPSRNSDLNVDDNRHRSTYIKEDDRNKYVYDGEKISYGTGTSAIVDIPVISHTKQSELTINRFELPIDPTKDYQRSRSRSPSTTSSDSYRRQSSRERQIDITDDYSRLNINDNNNNRNNRKYSNDNTVNTIPTENPYSSSSYETKYRNSNGSDREQYHSRESSPSAIRNINGSSSSVGGYVSTTTSATSNTYRVESSRDSTSPSKNYTTQYNYRNTETSSNVNDRRSSSPSTNDRTSSGLNDFITKTNLVGDASSSSNDHVSPGLIDFMSKTNLAGNISSSNENKNSTLSALAGGFRPFNHDNDDDNEN